MDDVERSDCRNQQGVHDHRSLLKRTAAEAGLPRDHALYKEYMINVHWRRLKMYRGHYDCQYIAYVWRTGTV